MRKTNRTFKLLTAMATMMLLAVIIVACSKSSDDVDENKGNGKVDPNVPVLSEIKYELNPQATIVPEDVAKQITAVDTLGQSFTLPLSAEKPEVGQTLIINTPSKMLHDGLLAKVKRVTETSTGYKIDYEDAELKDAFKDIDIPEQYIPIGDYVEHVYDADGNEITNYQTRSVTRASGVKSFEIVLPEIGWKIDEGVELTPKMSIDLLLRYVLQFGDYELSYAGVKIDADINVGADMNIELKASNIPPLKFHILTLVCGAIPIGPVLLTPSIDVYGVVSVEGKLTLEASISYERTLHARMVYQKGAGLTGECTLEEEDPEALKFTFGPKFEGGVGFGAAMGGNIGVFGKTLAVRTRITPTMKMTVSGKLDMAAFSGTLNDWLTPYELKLNPFSDDVKLILDYASKWKFDEYEDIMLNMGLGIKVGWDVTTIGVDVASTSLPEMSIPISSTPIMPQVKIDEKDFFNFNGNDVTLKLHHTGKSMLDGFVKFRAVFKSTDNVESKTLTKEFDFGDEQRNLLIAEIKGQDVTSKAKVTLNGEDDYNVFVYMDLFDVSIPIFEGFAKTLDVFGVAINGIIHCTSPTLRDGADHTLNPVASATSGIESMINLTRDGNKLKVLCYKVKEVADKEYEVTNDKLLSFTIDDVNALHTCKAKIQNLSIDGTFGFNSGDDPEYLDIYKTDFATDIPMTSNEGTYVLFPGAKMIGTWELTPVNGQSFSKFDYTQKDWVYKWDSKERKDVLDHIDYHQFTLTDNPENKITIRVAFK